MHTSNRYMHRYIDVFITVYISGGLECQDINILLISSGILCTENR